MCTHDLTYRILNCVNYCLEIVLKTNRTNVFYLSKFQQHQHLPSQSVCLIPSKYFDNHFANPQYSLYFHFWQLFSRWIWVSRYHNIIILDFIGAKDNGGGGDNWSYKTCKAPVKSSPSKNNTQLFTGWIPSCHPTNSVRALKSNPQYYNI